MCCVPEGQQCDLLQTTIWLEKPMLNIHNAFNSSRILYRSSYWCSGQDDWGSILECICKILQQHIDPKVQPAADHWYSARRCACHKSRSLMRFFFACFIFLETSGKHWRCFECALEELTFPQQIVCACGEQSISPFVLWTLLCTDRRIPADSSAFYCGPAQIWNLLVCAWPQKEVPVTWLLETNNLRKQWCQIDACWSLSGQEGFQCNLY